MGIGVYGLSGSRLASYPVACRSGRFARSDVHCRPAVIPYHRRGRFGNGLLQHSGLNIRHRSAACIGDFVHHMGLVIIAPVDKGTKARDKLYHGDVKVLSEAVGRQIRRSHVVRRIDQAGRPGLSGEIDVCLQPEIKRILISAELVITDGLRNSHHGYIAGLCHRLLQRQRACGMILTFYLMSSHLQKSVTDKGLVRSDGSQLQPHGHRKGLGGGAGLIGVGNTEIFPEVIQI